LIPATISFGWFSKSKYLLTSLAVIALASFTLVPLDFFSPFVGHLQRKFVLFLHGPWSEYIDRRDYELLIIAFIKSTLFYFITYRMSSIKEALSQPIYRLYAISMYLFPILLLAISSRTLLERYLYFGMIFYIPLIIASLELFRKKLNRYFVISLACLIFLLPQNIIVFGVVFTKSYTQETLSANLFELFNLEYSRAPDAVGRI
jgi:hypothetical protein